MELDDTELDLTPGTGVAPKTKMGSAEGDAKARAHVLLIIEKIWSDAGCA